MQPFPDMVHLTANTMTNQMREVDSAIVAGAQEGDRAAQARLYEAYSPMVYTLARRMLVSPALAEDVLQETFIEVIRKIESFRGDANIGFWIRRIAVNKCLMYLRSSWNSRQVDMELPDVPCLGGGEQAVLQFELESALAKISATARAVVWLHDVEGYTHKEIARLMGKTTSFSKSQLARAHERLRGYLDDDRTENGTELCTPVLKTC
jgi:RNA polymerase sigma-70 factor (ECF subfamily)